MWLLWLPVISLTIGWVLAQEPGGPVAPTVEPAVVPAAPTPAEEPVPIAAPADTAAPGTAPPLPAAPAVVTGSPDVPLLSAARAGVAPDIDGVRSEALWDRCLQMGQFTRLDGAERALDQTDVYITYDDVALYIAISCYEPTLESLATNSTTNDDVSIAKDDFVEVLISPTRTAASVARIVVNPLGTVLDMKSDEGGLAWNCPGLQVRTARGNYRWHVEMMVPFAAFDKLPAQGDVWGINFARFKPSSGEYSCYAGAGREYANPSSFATLLFAGAPVLVDLVEVGDAYGELRGGSAMRVRLKSTTARTVTPLVRVIRGTDVQVYTMPTGPVEIVGHRDKRVEVPYTVTDARGAEVQLGVVDEQKQAIYLSPRLPVHDTWLKPRVAALRAELGKYRELVATIATGPQGADILAGALSQPAAALDAIDASISYDAYGSVQRWRSLSDELQRVSEQIARISTTAAALKLATPEQIAAGQLPPFVVWNRAYMRPMTTQTPVDIDEVKPRTYLFASPGEYEPATFVVTAREDLKNVRVTVGDLKVGDSTLARDNIDIRIVKCWYQAGTGPQKEPGQRYFVPELLVKDDRVLYSGMRPDVRLTGDPATDIPAGQSRQFWLTIRVPAGTPAGLYTGPITITPENAPAQVQELQVKVLAIQLNAPPQKYYIYYRGVLTGTGPEVVTEDLLRRDLTNIREHGFDQATSYEPPDGLERMLQIRKELGMTEPIPYSLFVVRPEDIDSFVEGVRRLYGSQGLPALWFSTLDEPNTADEVQQSQALAGLIHAGGGRTFTTIDREFAVLHGDSLDYPNYNVQGPGFREYVVDLIKGTMPVDPRTEFYYWQCMLEDTAVNRLFGGLYLPKSRLDGVCPHVFQYTVGTQDPYDDFSGTSPFRPHMTTYPSANGPVDTVQWEAMREGRDDVRYYATLQALMSEATAFTSDPNVGVRLKEAQDTIAGILKTLQSDYRITLQSLDPRWYQERRWEMALRILRLQEAMRGTTTAPVMPSVTPGPGVTPAPTVTPAPGTPLPPV